ncbi:hypothetical protein [Clostridium thermopalmarium]|uniref:Uncharacterized protein n=1 Tax=Clostridium thermopalmarium DSM 5974 TaxID=1121340 RepID=A0A2T0AWJ6_9CLOT|nr:hypothetical protein [Clostridium thermopalmarium]PRR75109.1 hypothetical protein CPAL_06610 [Clostridium thermopalmarium DSM 5974]PVZ27865.1 hypothetical protein LX19_00404 [Clostridium thermopalmarium DSM 5974]
MQNKVEKECCIIENIIGTRVKTISLHNPSIHNQYPEFRGYKNAYSKEFFNTDLYISDYCKDFRGKNLREFMKKGRNNLIQVLFHPIHFSEKEESYMESFSRIIADNINRIDVYNSYSNKTYKKELNNNTLLEYFQNYIKENRLND